MTTPTLIERLIALGRGPCIFWEAADELKAQAAEIERLKKLVVWNQEQRELDLAIGKKERDALRAELAALKAQPSPVAQEVEREPVIDFTILHQFASDQAISYNKLCTAVRMSITQQKKER
jgi:hypothetical protein